MNLSNDAERTIEKLHITTKAETDKRILEEAFDVFEKSAFQKPPKSGHDVRPSIFHNTFFKISAVAAVFVIIFAVFFNRDTKTDFENIYDSLAKADNLCISTYLAGETQPSQQLWKTRNIKLFRIGKQNNIQYTFWDLSKKAKMTAFLSSNTIQKETLTEETAAEFEDTMTQSLGFLADTKIIPENAQWIYMDNPGVVTIVPDSRIFELTWSQETVSGSIIYRKERVFVDAKTNLPLRVESYIKFTPKGQYELENFSVFTYPPEDEIEAVAEKVFNPAYRQQGRPQPIGTPGM